MSQAVPLPVARSRGNGYHDLDRHGRLSCPIAGGCRHPGGIGGRPTPPTRPGGGDSASGTGNIPSLGANRIPSRVGPNANRAHSPDRSQAAVIAHIEPRQPSGSGRHHHEFLLGSGQTDSPTVCRSRDDPADRPSGNHRDILSQAGTTLLHCRARNVSHGSAITNVSLKPDRVRATRADPIWNCPLFRSSTDDSSMHGRGRFSGTDREEGVPRPDRTPVPRCPRFWRTRDAPPPLHIRAGVDLPVWQSSGHPRGLPERGLLRGRGSCFQLSFLFSLSFLLPCISPRSPSTRGCATTTHARACRRRIREGNQPKHSGALPLQVMHDATESKSTAFPCRCVVPSSLVAASSMSPHAAPCGIYEACIAQHGATC